jgi:hypothetical protein
MKITEAQSDASKEVGLEGNAEKTQYRYIFTSRHQTTGQNRYMKVANIPFEIVAKFKYLGSNLTKQNRIHGEIKSLVNSGNVCQPAIQNVLSFRQLSKNLNIKTAYTKLYRPIYLLFWMSVKPGLSRQGKNTN